MPKESLCNTTNNASLSMSILSRYPASAPSAKLQSLTAFIVDLALVEVHSSYLVAQGLLDENSAPTNGKSTLQDCLEQMSDCRDSLKQSKRRLQHLDGHNPPLMVTAQVMDVRVWLSASLTYMETWGRVGRSIGSITQKSSTWVGSKEGGAPAVYGAQIFRDLAATWWHFYRLRLVMILIYIDSELMFTAASA
ncbi:hypothetical protein KP509_1Z036600 [Ceratopteris richardii]|nr:hypothetical protein KP509_1Z036600 [Ceratopteris richardii]